MTFMTRDVQLSRDLQRVVSPILHFIYKTPSEFMIDRVIGQEWSWVLFLTIFYSERLSKKSQNHGGRLNRRNAMPSQSTCPILNDYNFTNLLQVIEALHCHCQADGYESDNVLITKKGRELSIIHLDEDRLDELRY